MGLKVNGISHITFICKNIEKTAKMLKEVLGAEEVYCSSEKHFSISKEKFLTIGGVWIAIMEGEPTTETYNHIAFQVNEDQLNQFEIKIHLFGLKILTGRPRDPREGRSLYFYDYDNHLFELHTSDLTSRLRFYNENV